MNSFMQNKPNFMENRANVSYGISKGYENAPPIFGPKIPNPISPGAQMNLTPYITTHYAPRTTPYEQKNKPNTNPKQSQINNHNTSNMSYRSPRL